MPVRDSRNRRIAGLSARNGPFYGVLWADRGDGTKGTRRFPLLEDDGAPIRMLTAAKDAFDALKNSRRENALPQPGHKPSFDTFVAEYLTMATTQKKNAGTIENEMQSLASWRAHLGTVRIDRIATPAIKKFMEKRMAGCTLGGSKFAGAAPRTVELDFVVLRNAIKAAAEVGHLRDIPRFPKLATPPPPRRPPLSPAEGNLWELKICE